VTIPCLGTSGSFAVSAELLGAEQSLKCTAEFVFSFAVLGVATLSYVHWCLHVKSQGPCRLSTSIGGFGVILSPA